MNKNKIDSIVDELREELNSQMLSEIAKTKRFPSLVTELNEYLNRFESIIMKIEYTLSVLVGIVNNIHNGKKVEEKDLRNKILSYDLNNIGLTIRTCANLNSYNIKKVEELINLTEEELKKYPNIDNKSISEIKERLAEVGLFLKKH